MKQIEKIFIPTENGFLALHLDSVILLKAEGSYTIVKTKSKEYMVSRNIKQFEELLPSSSFFRVHNSYIISFHSINSISKNKRLTLTLEENIVVPIADSKKKEFFQKIKLVSLMI